MCRASPQMCSRQAPFRAPERQISEIRLVAMMIAHDLNLLLRSTARIGSTCVPKQPYDNAGKTRCGSWPGSSGIQAHSDLCAAYCVLGEGERSLLALCQYGVDIGRICDYATIALLDRLQTSNQDLCNSLLEIAIPHACSGIFGERRITCLRDTEQIGNARAHILGVHRRERVGRGASDFLLDHLRFVQESDSV